VKRNKKFKIFFTNTENKTFDVDYVVNESLVAEKWFRKIKHLHKVAIDPIESGLEDTSDLKTIYLEFCSYADIPTKELDFMDLKQEHFNFLHRLYEENHERLSRMKNNKILYRFHHAIHDNEGTNLPTNRMPVGWGIKEGPLTEKLQCNQYYESTIKQNFVYADWSELGKTPYQYWAQQEPSEQTSVIELCKPHVTLRPKFFIALRDHEPQKFDQHFTDWFSQYSQQWLTHYGLPNWRPVDEHSAPLLAHTDYKGDLSHHMFSKILLS